MAENSGGCGGALWRADTAHVSAKDHDGQQKVPARQRQNDAQQHNNVPALLLYRSLRDTGAHTLYRYMFLACTERDDVGSALSSPSQMTNSAPYPQLNRHGKNLARVVKMGILEECHPN